MSSIGPLTEIGRRAPAMSSIISAPRSRGAFLAGTWKLLPELNSALALSGIYTIQDYRARTRKLRARDRDE